MQMRFLFLEKIRSYKKRQSSFGVAVFFGENQLCFLFCSLMRKVIRKFHLGHNVLYICEHKTDRDRLAAETDRLAQRQQLFDIDKESPIHYNDYISFFNIVRWKCACYYMYVVARFFV